MDLQPRGHISQPPFLRVILPKVLARRVHNSEMALEPRGQREEHVSQPPHLALILPEILDVIMSYVPTTDLLASVTHVSRGWEDAARHHLASRSLVDLTPTNMPAYLDTAKTCPYPHKRVHLSDFNFPQMSPEESNLLQAFISSPSTVRITELHLDYFPHGGEPIPAQILALLSTSPSLKYVHFSPKEFTPEMFQPFAMCPTRVKFPNVTKLGIDLPQTLYFGDMSTNIVRSVSQETIRGIVALFPNLKRLQCDTLPQDLVEYFLSGNLSIEEISLRLDRTIKQRPLSIVSRSIFLTQIEFKIDTFNKSTDHHAILATFADRLEKLKISGVDVVSPEFCNLIRAGTITLPEVLPKLKSLEISICPVTLYCRFLRAPKNSPKVPALNLKFSKAEECVQYANQFPVLEKFVVSKVNYSAHPLNEVEWFEISAALLYKFFLHGESLTVQNVHVPLPPKGMKRFKLLTNFPDCQNKFAAERVLCSQFFRRMVTTFPNLNTNLERV
ncbi:uncharacterized protein LOC118439498 [Folsomia candida]|nr:uncharacterized protein LOC118439498 [Folsomia candida]